MFLKHMLAQLSRHRFSKSSKYWCMRHKTYCRRFSQGSGRLLLEVAGTVCVGFATLGQHWGFLDESSIAFVCWCWLMNGARPDLIIHECVPGFPTDILRMCLNHEEEVYNVETFVFPQAIWARLSPGRGGTQFVCCRPKVASIILTRISSAEPHSDLWLCNKMFGVRHRRQSSTR